MKPPHTEVTNNPILMRLVQVHFGLGRLLYAKIYLLPVSTSQLCCVVAIIGMVCAADLCFCAGEAAQDCWLSISLKISDCF